ncbi:MAG: hypothetical protein WAL04_03990 [Acidimicrobiales bacterium]|jgi:hypothetical protein
MKGRRPDSHNDIWRTFMKRFVSFAVALAALGLTVSACGGGGNATATTVGRLTGAARVRESATFLKLEAPYNAAVKKFDARKAAPKTTARLQAFLGPLVAASDTFATGIQGADFTGPASTPAQAVAIAVESLVADSESATVSNWTSEKAMLAQDEATVNRESNILRATLGLPALTS